MNKIIIDLEFTGLDNDFIKDNEVIELKMKNLTNGKTFIKNYYSEKRLSAHAQLEHKVERYDGDKFNKMEFIDAMCLIGAEFSDEYIGFSPQMDEKMLQKYGVSIYDIKDIKEMIMLSKHEDRLACEGRGLEECYLIVTGKAPDISSHKGIGELLLIEELYNESINLEQKDHLTVVPWGFAAGMPIEDFVSENRRNADGYRYNNDDIYASALDLYIEREDDYYDDDDDDDDWGSDNEEENSPYNEDYEYDEEENYKYFNENY